MRKRWDGNRFSTFTSEEVSTLELIEEVGQQANANTDKLTDKTDLKGDHKGSWHGIEKPQFAEPGIAAVVDKLVGKVDNFEKTTKKFCSISSTSFPTFKLEDRPTAIEVIKRQNLDLTYCDMISVPSLTSSTFTYNIPRFKNSLQNLKNKGIRTIMIKPHIGVDYSDNTYRPNYKPSNVGEFFTNWLKVLKDYAALCNEFEIPFLALSVEMDFLCLDDKIQYWKVINEELHKLYPTLKLVHCFTTTFWGQDIKDREIYKYCDVVGLNAYLSLTDKVSSSLTSDDVSRMFSQDLWGVSLCQSISYIANKYNKKIMITETGCINSEKGLHSFDTNNPTDNHLSQYLFHKSLCTVVYPMPEVIGFALWHTEVPWAYYEDILITDAEQIITNYVMEVGKL